MKNYIVQSPVLLMIFNRPDTTFQVFDKITNAKPSRLYIAADGPRNNNQKDIELCEEARSVVEKINWDCTVKTLFRQENKGCKIAVSSALNWFFEQEAEGIILEDDCLPADSFFYFCDRMLERYRNDTRIFCITGSNHQEGKIWGNASYYFSQISNVWGWAEWRRVWRQYDVELKKYKTEEVAYQLKKIFTDPFLIAQWVEYFKELKEDKIDTWDYQFHFLNFFESGLCVVPNVNLISNIGFRTDATHTWDANNHNANLPTGEINEIKHPVYFLPEKDADYFLLSKEFNLDEKWRQHNKSKRRLNRWFKNIFK